MLEGFLDALLDPEKAVQERVFAFGKGEGALKELIRAPKGAKQALFCKRKRRIIVNQLSILGSEDMGIMIQDRPFLWKLGLIELVDEEPASQPKFFRRVYYRLVPRREADPRWARPQVALDARRGLGKRRYKRKP